MTSAVQTILSRIDELSPSEREELESELRLRARASYKTAASTARGQTPSALTDADIDKALTSLRYSSSPAANTPPATSQSRSRV